MTRALVLLLTAGLLCTSSSVAADRPVASQRYTLRVQRQVRVESVDEPLPPAMNPELPHAALRVASNSAVSIRFEALPSPSTVDASKPNTPIELNVDLMAVGRGAWSASAADSRLPSTAFVASTRGGIATIVVSPGPAADRTSNAEVSQRLTVVATFTANE